jgi:chromate transport protein ChrA
VSIAVDLGRPALRSARAWIVAVCAAVALALRWLTLLEVVVIAGIVGVIFARPPREPEQDRSFAWPGFWALSATPPVLALFGVFARIGIATFGGGIAMIPAIEHEAIARGWLDPQTFADAVTFGQVTPGPVGVVATFVGWRVAGPLGAVAATLGVFAPPAVLALLVARSLRAFQESRGLQGFLRGVTPAVVGLVAAAALAVGRASVHDTFDLAICAVAALRIVRPRTSPLWPLALGAAAGLGRALFLGRLAL